MVFQLSQPLMFFGLPLLITIFLSCMVPVAHVFFYKSSNIELTHSFFSIFQVIFSEMFKLPNSHHPQIFYGALIIELCKLQPNSIPGIVSFLVSPSNS